MRNKEILENLNQITKQLKTLQDGIEPSPLRPLSSDEFAHLRFLKQEVVVRLDTKYREGAIKHGGDLMDKTPLQLNDEAIAEAIDQLVYLLTLRKKLTFQFD